MSSIEQELRAATGHDFLQRPLGDVDPDIAGAIRMETARQNDTLELIASENHVSRAVLTAMGSVFTNKYAEGYPGKRYYGRSEQHTSELQSPSNLVCRLLLAKRTA